MSDHTRAQRPSTDGPDPAALASDLAKLTSGWKPAPGVPSEALTAARSALAHSLLAGRTLADTHAVRLPIKAAPPVNPALEGELLRIATDASAAARPATAAVVRSATAASIENPAGMPGWARGAQVIQSYGPFIDPQGVVHWVDLIVFTRSVQFAFGSPGAGFGVFPVHGSLVLPPHPTHLTLGAGSVWFLSNLLSSAVPAGAFAGFKVTGGSLNSSAPLDLQGGVYVVPAGATLTATVTLAAAAAPGGSGAGEDAAGAVFQPPATVTISFKAGEAAFEDVADLSATAYGSTLKLHWNKKTPVQPAGLPAVVVPCDAKPATFAFAAVKSTIFHPSGSAPVTLAGWALPLSAVAIGSLPEAAGPGAALVQFGAGVSVTNSVEPQPVPVKSGVAEISTGGLFVQLSGKAHPATTVYQLWPEAPPSRFNSTVAFATPPAFVFSYLSSTTEELLASGGQVTAHLDRPLDATGARFSYQSDALLLLSHTSASDSLTIIGTRKDVPKPILPLALTNALLGVDAPAALVVAGTLSGTSLLTAGVALYFDLRWLLPTLPDPYAANFDLSVVPRERQTSVGTLVGLTLWAGGAADPELSFALLPPSTGSAVKGTPFPASVTVAGEVSTRAAVSSATPALLDLSTRVDLFGVALAPAIGRMAGSGGDRSPAPAQGKVAPALALTGMSLSLNSGIVATFALPQSSWEPMESTAVDITGPIFCEPASDGFPLLACSPDFQKLVPFSPEPVLVGNIDNVQSGHPFAAVFSLPFGLNAAIIEPNGPIRTKLGRRASRFLFEGGEFRTNEAQFPESFVPDPPVGTPRVKGALTLVVKPAFPDRPDATFHGLTEVDTLHGSFFAAPPPTPAGYGYAVIGGESGKIFEGDFGASGKLKGVPVRRIDFSGYGASIFSDWNKPDQIPPAVIKVQFETSIGRTGFEVIQVESVIYPYCVLVVRTVTMSRQNAGWVKRTDTGWQAVTPGRFQFPADTAAQWADAVHPGAFEGAFNVRNIRDLPDQIQVPNPADPTHPFEFRKVLFDADLGVNPTLNVLNGGFKAPVSGVTSPPVLVASRDIVGWVQVAPDSQSPSPNVMRDFFTQSGIFTPTIACDVEAGRTGGQPGTTLRCSAFEVNIITQTNTGGNTPALGVALRGAVRIPRGGGWSLGQRKFTDPAPSALPGDFPLPLVQPAGVTNKWFLADVTDVLQLTQPNNFYNLMHSTGTNKVLFEQPQIPVGAVTPGLQFPKPGAPKPGGAPANPGSPNLGDIASILNSTGLFPDIANALSLLQGALEQVNTIGQGFKYSKTFDFDPNEKVTLIDLGVIDIALQYADTTIPGPPTAAQLIYSVDSSASPSWKLSIGPLSFQVTVPLFGSDPILTITGGFYADEHTNAGLSNLNIHMGDALSVVKNVFSDLQALAQFLPGGAAANLNIALSNGKLTVSDSFSIADLPLGLGDLTDVSLNLGLAVTLQPLSVDFSVGIGSPQHPFNWIVSPLAGNGMMQLGVAANQPSFIIQAGIGLGLAIDLGIAEGSASITIAVQLNVTGNEIILMAILSGQASVDVLDGLASASLTLTAALGFGLSPAIPPVKFTPPPPAIPDSVSIGPETITLLASCSVGIHISICWVVSISWDGSWEFSQSVTTPQITVNA